MTTAISQHVAALSGTLPAIPKQPTALDKSRAAAELSVAQLMDTPLQQLVDELHVTLDESSITDPEFTGYMYATRKTVVVSLPPNRSELEHDCMARYFIGRAFHVKGLPPLPEPFAVTDFTGDSDPDMDEALRRVRQGGVA
ncbi:hypothetical protein [Streptomyces africanus]|uniref:hypothetical protein n=1 Tax=Streptomyces africanus TaxID=231024 RepID=UPI000A361941|nr:hypothetical protein [Streptomyces africanus]